MRLLFLTLAGFFPSLPSVRADDDSPATLAGVHHLLLEAAGYQNPTPPSPEEQTELLKKALHIMEGLPPVYHGHLAKAKRSVEAALSELGEGDRAGRAKEDIYDADDQIKSIM
jgi:hypothetical protein